MQVTTEALQYAAEQVNLGDEETSVRTDYSGRAMYGRTCLGVVTDDLREVFRFVVALADTDCDITDERICTDSMGRSSIYYWPSVEVAGSEAS